MPSFKNWKHGSSSANAPVDSGKPRFAIEAHLGALFGADTAEGCSDATTQEDATSEDTTAAEAPPLLPAPLPQAQREKLAQANATRHDWIARAGWPDRTVIRSGNHRIADYKVSTTDPDATLMPTKGSGIHLGYHTRSVVNGGKRRIILDVLVTPSEVMENQPMLDLVFRARFRWKLWPRQATGDTTYGSAENIMALEGEDIRAYVPLSPYDQRSPYFSLSAFRYDAQRDISFALITPSCGSTPRLNQGCQAV